MRTLPIIRHIRAMHFAWCVNRHYDMCARLGFLPLWSEAEVQHHRDIWGGRA